jgi:hypothetical protein
VRISRLRDNLVICQFDRCQDTAVFLLHNAVGVSGGKLLVAYCRKHTCEFASRMEEPFALPDRMLSGKAGSPTIRTAAVS